MRCQLLIWKQKLLSSQIVHLISNKLLWWSLNYNLVGVNHRGDIKIEELIISNHTIGYMWSVTLSQKERIIRYREEMTKHLEEKKILES